MSKAEYNRQRFQEIANRGLQDRLDPDKRARFDEALRRGLITAPPAPKTAPVVEETPAPPELLLPEAQALPNDQRKALLEARDQQLSVYGNDVEPSQPSAAVERENYKARLRHENPHLANVIEQMTPTEKLAVGFQQGLRNVARGSAKLAGQDIFAQDKSIFDPLQRVSGFAKTGKIAGESAPFVTAAPIAGGGLTTRAAGRTLIPAARTTTSRAVGTGGISGAESSAIAAGEDQGVSSVVASGVMGSVLGSGLEVWGALSSGSRSELRRIARGPSERDVFNATREATPTIEQLKQTSREVFQAVEAAGVSIAPRYYQAFVTRTRNSLENSGLDHVNTPKAYRALTRLEQLLENPGVSFRDLDRIRETAMAAAGDTQNNKERALGSQIIERIDDLFDGPTRTVSPNGNASVGQDLRIARNLWGRARKSEMIEEAVERARTQASGFENGLRIQFRQILNNKKRSRFFSDQEIAVMRRVEQGSRSANLARFLGGFAFSGDQGKVRNILGGAAGASLGGAVGGVSGAIVMPVIGEVSRTLAERLTRRNADFANQVIRAGTDAQRIVTAYLRNTTQAERDPHELAQLLMRPDIQSRKLVAELPVVQEALTLVQRSRAPLAAAVVPIAAAADNDEEQ